jgi:hypothetical protein
MLIQAAVTLNLYLKLLTSDDLRHGINAFTLVCRESKNKVDQLEMNFDKVQRALRVRN